MLILDGWRRGVGPEKREHRKKRFPETWIRRYSLAVWTKRGAGQPKGIKKRRHGKGLKRGAKGGG